MELKQLHGQRIRNMTILLIVPYGIETTNET